MAFLLNAGWAIQDPAGPASAVATLSRLARGRISMSWVTVAVICEPEFTTISPRAHLTAFRQFLSPYHILDLNAPIVERIFDLRAYLRRRGELISDFDILLGARALHDDLKVLTFTVRHLARIPGQRLYLAG